MLSDTLRTSRLAAGFTQDRLAEAAGLNKRTISRMEGGSPVQAETLLALCSVLKLDYASLERMRRREAVQDPAPPPVLMAGNGSVARHLVDDALASLRDQPGVELVALPDLAAWRASRGAGPDRDLDRPAFQDNPLHGGVANVGSIAGFVAAILVIPTGLSVWLSPGSVVHGVMILLAAFAAVFAGGFLLVERVGAATVRREANRADERVLMRRAYGFSRDSVWIVEAGDETIDVARFDLASKRQVRREDHGACVTYEFVTDRGHVVVAGIPHDPRVEAVLMRTTPEDPVRSIARPLAAAA